MTNQMHLLITGMCETVTSNREVRPPACNVYLSQRFATGINSSHALLAVTRLSASGYDQPTGACSCVNHLRDDPPSRSRSEFCRFHPRAAPSVADRPWLSALRDERLSRCFTSAVLLCGLFASTAADDCVSSSHISFVIVPVIKSFSNRPGGATRDKLC